MSQSIIDIERLLASFWYRLPKASLRLIISYIFRFGKSYLYIY